MATTVRVTALTGPHKNRRFCLRGPMRCTVGRANDCGVRLSGDERDHTISRHHCQLDIDPPSVRVQDLGSLNGTYRNGKKLEPAEADVTDAGATLLRKLSVTEVVENGDVITVGETSFQVDRVDCPLGTPMPDNNSPVWPAGAAVKADCPVSC